MSNDGNEDSRFSSKVFSLPSQSFSTMSNALLPPHVPSRSSAPCPAKSYARLLPATGQSELTLFASASESSFPAVRACLRAVGCPALSMRGPTRLDALWGERK